MTGREAKLPRSLQRWRPALHTWLGLHAAALAVALAVAFAPGAAHATRRLLALNIHLPAGDLAEAAGIFVHNLLVLAPLLLGRWLGRGRPLLRAYGAWLAGWAVLTVGAALGAYGPALLVRLGHVPVEWTALAVALTAPADRRLRPCIRSPQSAILVTALLVSSGLLEVLATPH